MSNDLQLKTEEWKSLERTTFKQREVAEQFYEKQLMKLITKEFVKNNKHLVLEPVKNMILSVGTSYEPLVLSINLFRPQKVLFLYTEKSLKYLEKVIKICKLPMQCFVRKCVDENNPLDIYQEVKNIYLEWNKPERIYVDFTGGTKAMSVAAAMAGAMVDIQLVYIGTSNYLVDFRKPEPGSEYVQFIANPYEVFGDLEIEKAIELVAEANYGGAGVKLEGLLDKVPDPMVRQHLELIYLLVKTYEYWDDLKFQDALKHIKMLHKNLIRDSVRNPHLVLLDFLNPIRMQMECLERLTEMREILKDKGNYEVLQSRDHIVPLMFTMYINAGVRELQGKYDMATLLMYRLLEMISQRRLSLYHINASRPDYLNIKIDKDKLSQYAGLDSQGCLERYKQEVFEIKQKLFGKQASAYLPAQISLLEGFVQLCALGDELFGSGQQSLTYIKRICYMVSLRNKSIFAHGLVPVEFGEYEKFKLFVVTLFKQFCEIENIDFEDTIEKLGWKNPRDSKFYSF